MELTLEQFRQTLLESQKPVLVDFWASWCPPCKMMEPMMARLEKEFQETTPIYKMNIDRNPQVADQYHIKGVPTFILFYEGKEVQRQTGALTENQLRKLLALPVGK